MRQIVRRIVIVGAGMAAQRLCEGLVERGVHRQDRITVLGDESVAPYNRILLSAVLEGTHSAERLRLRPEVWWAEHGIDLRTSARVLAIDPERRDVMLTDGETIDYDVLVLATGSIPTLPPIRGLVHTTGQLDPRVHAFRSLADCERLAEAVTAQPSARVVVVGGGLLGLQVARALAERGMGTEVVEGADHLLHRQLGQGAAGVVRRELERLGTQVYLGARAIRLTDAGLRLDNDYLLETDLVVLAAGGRPSVALARGAGLMVRRGVVVDGRLESVSHPGIHAIGDCAEHRGVVSGFVGSAWDKASALAGILAGGEQRYAGSRTVARLRATGLDVAVLGDPELAEPHEVVEVTNPIRRSARKLVVRGGRIEAAAFVGDLTQVGLITQLYDRGTVLGPLEPGDLLMPEGGGVEVELPDEAELCACSGATFGQVRACRTLAEVKEKTRATTGCGGCAEVVNSLLGSQVAAGRGG